MPQANDGAGNAFWGNLGDDTGYVYQTNAACSSTIAEEAGDFDYPGSMVIDSHGQLWTASINDSTLSFTGRPTCETGGSTQYSASFTGGGMQYPANLTLDGNGNVFVSNAGNGSVSEFNSSGVAITSSNALVNASITSPSWIQADGSGNIWIPDYSSSSVVEFVGLSTPVITPLAAGLPSTLNTTGLSSLATRP